MGLFTKWFFFACGMFVLLFSVTMIFITEKLAPSALLSWIIFCFGGGCCVHFSLDEDNGIPGIMKTRFPETSEDFEQETSISHRKIDIDPVTLPELDPDPELSSTGRRL